MSEYRKGKTIKFVDTSKDIHFLNCVEDNKCYCKRCKRNRFRKKYVYLFGRLPLGLIGLLRFLTDNQTAKVVFTLLSFILVVHQIICAISYIRDIEIEHKAFMKGFNDER